MLTVSTKHIRDLADAREQAHAIVKRYNNEALWDSIQARDIPPEVLEYVIEAIKNGFELSQVRRQLGIISTVDKAWKKILAGIRQGVRIDSTGMYLRWHWQNENLARKMQDLLELELENMQKAARGELEKPDGTKVAYSGFTKELTMAVDALNRLRQGTVKLGKELGVFEQPGQSGGGGSGGVTIIVKSNVPMPSMEQIKEHQAAQQKKNKELLEKAKTITSTAKVLSEDPEPKA
jgi:hypothetical protein